MVVRVVSRPPPRRVMCRGCGCQLEYEQKDVIKEVARLDQSTMLDYIMCPECDSRVIIPKHLPPNTR